MRVPLVVSPAGGADLDHMDAQEALALVLTGAMLTRAGSAVRSRSYRNDDTRPPGAVPGDGAMETWRDVGEDEST